MGKKTKSSGGLIDSFAEKMYKRQKSKNSVRVDDKGHESHGTTRHGRGSAQTDHIKFYLSMLFLPIYIGLFLASPIKLSFNYNAAKYFKDLGIYMNQAGLWKFIPKLNRYSIPFIIGCVIVYTLGYAYYAVKTPHPFKNKEYGTSKLIDATDITKRYTAPPDEKYLIKRHDDKGNEITVNTAERRISENIYLSTVKDLPCETTANNNILTIGGSGSGKTFRLLSPLISSEYGSFVCTDPKMEITHKVSEMFIESGYRTLTLNFYDEDAMLNSAHYNPWKYVKTETDCAELIGMFIKSTGGKSTGDNSFWDDATAGVLEALGWYMMTELPESKHTFRTLMALLDGCNVKTETTLNDKGQEVKTAVKGPTFEKFDKLKEKYWDRDSQICTHSSYEKFYTFLDGAEETVKNTMASIMSRAKSLKIEAVLKLTDYDDIDIPTIGAGVNYDGKTKTFLSIVTAEGSTTFSFLVSMFYLQLWRKLYEYSDRFLNGNPLPIQVSAILDEFANCEFPTDFPSLLSTFRSRNCDACIILQDFSQLEEKYEKLYRSVQSNCSTLVFLGSNELETCKLVSEMLGDMTIAKRNTTEQSKGGNSHSEDVMQRNVMTPSELMNLPKDKCVVKVQNEMPVVDLKTQTQLMPRYAQLCNGNYNPPAIPINVLEEISDEDYTHFHNYCMLNGDDILVLSMDDVLSIPDFDNDGTVPFEITREQLEANRLRMEEEERKAKEEEQQKLDALGTNGVMKLLKLRKNGFSDTQIDALRGLLMTDEYSVDDILSMFSTDMNIASIQTYVSKLIPV